MIALTPERLAEIEARAKAATPGEWEAFGLFGNEAHVWVNGRLIASGLTRNDARLVAHARTDIPALLRDLRTAREALANVVKATSHGQDRHSAAAHSIARAALSEETPNG